MNMRAIRCKNGHFYDADRFTSCPQCKKEEMNPMRQEKTSSASDKKKNHTELQEKEPYKPVGWLVGISGTEYGTIYTLKSGNNKIGAQRGLDVYLKSAQDLSEACQIIVAYNTENKKFSVQAGNARELSYVNGEVILINRNLQARDKIQIGKNSFIFIPLCGDDFNWEDR